MSEREFMEYDVVTVGAGPAGLAFAIRLKQLKPDIRVSNCCPNGAKIRRRSACPSPKTNSGGCAITHVR
jgi:pyruvate/2-oxoglutarate dehydrogenase complex dihydrolipoamide dehydrogenase (E3) component